MKKLILSFFLFFGIYSNIFASTIFRESGTNYIKVNGVYLTLDGTNKFVFSPGAGLIARTGTGTYNSGISAGQTFTGMVSNGILTNVSALFVNNTYNDNSGGSQNYTFCGNTDRNLFHVMVSDSNPLDYRIISGYNCSSPTPPLSGYHYFKESDLGINSVPNPEPITSFVNGLECTTDYIATTSGATWYNVGSLPNFSYLTGSGYEGKYGFYMTGTGGSSDYDSMISSPYGSGTFYDSGTIKYPGTNTGYIRDTLEDFATTIFLSYRNGNPTDYNIVQFGGIDNIAFGQAGLITGETTAGDLILSTPISASGGVATFALKNYNGSIKYILMQYLYRFNGFRIGKGNLEAKKACSVNFNICEWSYEGANLACVSGKNAGGVEFNGCGITGSGSIYGSGACVPLVDGSGAIIPPPAGLGGFVTKDENGNVVGTVYQQESGDNFLKNIFTCRIDDDDSWWTKIGDILYCPITIIQNAGGVVWDGVTGVTSRVNQIEQNTTGTLSGVTQAGTGTSYTGSNTLINSLGNIDEEISQSNKVKLFYWLFILLALVFFIGVLVSILKK